MAATCCLQHGCFEVNIAEALAARHCLTIALDARLRDLVLETNCSKLYQYLLHGKCETSAFGVIVSDILLLASSFFSISISHVGRDGNCAVFLLARGSIEFGEMRNLVCAKNLVIDKNIQTAYIEAIRSTQHFIYIENQYFLGSSYAWPNYKNAGADHLMPMELALKIVSKIRGKERFAV
uniref:RNase H type-1 domain-containing protein n=1 Tax=Chenopodium quinoa TaxID=63459 RepID=A0A803MWY0_CHEQI